MNKITNITPGFGDESAPPQVDGNRPDATGTSTIGHELTIGQELKAARESRGEDLTAVARALRIRRDHLEAIEAGRVDDLPGRTYAVGFVRSYVEYLGLGAEYIERFKSEIGGRGEHSPLKGLPPDAGEGGLPYGWLLMALVVVGVVGYAGYHLIHSAESPAVQPVAPVPAVMAPESAKHVPAPKRPVPALQVHAGPISIPAAGGATPANAPAGSAAPATPVNPAAPPNPAFAALPQGQVYGVQNKKARVVLHARTVTHVLVEGPGGKVFINRVLHPGDTYRVPDLVGLSLTTPDGGTVLLELDGQNMGVAGHTGQLTEALSLDPQAIVDRAHAGNPG